MSNSQEEIATFQLNCDGKEVGKLIFEGQKLKKGAGNYFPNTSEQGRQKTTRGIPPAVVLSVMTRYINHDDLIGNFQYKGQRWSFKSLEFEESINSM